MIKTDNADNVKEAIDRFSNNDFGENCKSDVVIDELNLLFEGFKIKI